MSDLEKRQGKPMRTDYCFLSTTLSQCTSLVIEDPCRAIPAVSKAPLQCVPVVWQMCSPEINSKFSVLHYQVQQSSVALSSNTFVKCGNPTLETDLKQSKKDVNTPGLDQLIWYECPFALDCNLYNGCLLNQWIVQLHGDYTASGCWTGLNGRTEPPMYSPR